MNVVVAMVIVVAGAVRVQRTHSARQCWRGRRVAACLRAVIGRLVAIVLLLLFDGSFVAAEFASYARNARGSKQWRAATRKRGSRSKRQACFRGSCRRVS